MLLNSAQMSENMRFRFDPVLPVPNSSAIFDHIMKLSINAGDHVRVIFAGSVSSSGTYLNSAKH